MSRIKFCIWTLPSAEVLYGIEAHHNHADRFTKRKLQTQGRGEAGVAVSLQTEPSLSVLQRAGSSSAEEGKELLRQIETSSAAPVLLTVSLYLQAFVLFNDRQSCCRFVDDYLNNPVPVEGNVLDIHIINQVLAPGSSEVC